MRNLPYIGTHATIFSLIIILLCSLAIRISIVYLNDERHLTVPDFYFARDKIGMDFQQGALETAQDVISGKASVQKTFYGSAYPLTLAATFPVMRTFQACNNLKSESCIALYYRMHVITSLLLFAAFILFIMKKQSKQIIAMLLFIIFLTGIPGSRGIETGNIDIALSGIFMVATWVLFKKRKSQTFTNSGEIIIGFMFGWLANAKIFLLPFALAAGISSANPAAYIIAMTASFFGFALLPSLFGSTVTAVDPFLSAGQAYSVFLSKQLFTNYPGNNAISTFSTLIPEALGIRTAALASVASLIVTASVFFGIFIAPFLRAHMKNPSILLERHGDSLLQLLFSVGIAAITVLPPVSFDYRLYFMLGFLIIRIAQNIPKESSRMVYLSILFFCIRSLWFTHARVMNIFLYVSCYYLIRSAITSDMLTTQGRT